MGRTGRIISICVCYHVLRAGFPSIFRGGKRNDRMVASRVAFLINATRRSPSKRQLGIRCRERVRIRGYQGPLVGPRRPGSRFPAYSTLSFFSFSLFFSREQRRGREERKKKIDGKTARARDARKIAKEGKREVAESCVNGSIEKKG